MKNLEKFSPLRVAVTGIDGAGKSTAVDSVSSYLGVQGRILKGTNRPVYSVIEGNKQYHYRKLLQLVDKIHGYADESGSRNFVCAVNTFNILLQARHIEPTLTQKLEPDLILGARDVIIDPSVYAIFYSGQLSKRAMPERVNLLKRMTGAPYRDIIFFLTLPPELAVDRIDERLKAQIEVAPTDRPKWAHMHENADALRNLQREYYDALQQIQQRSCTQIFEVATEDFSKDNVAEIINDILKARLRSQDPNPSLVGTNPTARWIKINKKSV